MIYSRRFYSFSPVVPGDGGVSILFIRFNTEKNSASGFFRPWFSDILPTRLLALATIVILLLLSLPATRVCASAGWWVPSSVEIERAVADVSAYRERTIRGFYLPSNLVADEARMSGYLDLIADTELNAVVIDIKDDRGWITYETELELPREYRAVDARMGDLRELAGKLEAHGIHAIGRLVVFKDDRLAMARPDLTIRQGGSGPWRDSTGAHWVDPYSREVWDYNSAVGREVIEMGFPEVQLDYVRFPTDGNVRAAEYPHLDGTIHRSRLIADFIKDFHWQVFSAGGLSSIDIFGLVPTVRDDMQLGQQWEEVIEVTDFVSPMVYPSHYGPNIYGLPVPNHAPYETVWHTMRDGLQRWEAGDSLLRPWLQDFSWGYRYGPSEVRGQIRATEEHGIDSWLLWNAAGVYTRDALHPSIEGEDDEIQSGTGG